MFICCQIDHRDNLSPWAADRSVFRKIQFILALVYQNSDIVKTDVLYTVSTFTRAMGREVQNNSNSYDNDNSILNWDFVVYLAWMIIFYQ